MGTNYYLSEEGPCPTCGRSYENLHIGKSSAGWVFALRRIPEEGIFTLDDWKRRWVNGVILDEYDRIISPEEMLSVITERGRGGPPQTDQWLIDNHAIPGPNGLVRHSSADHGEGTWDYVEGEFS